MAKANRGAQNLSQNQQGQQEVVDQETPNNAEAAPEVEDTDPSKDPQLPNNGTNPLPAPAPKEEVDEDISKDGKTFFGKGDKEKKHPIPVHNKKHVVVRQAQVKSENGGMYEVPNTAKVQAYSPEVYQNLLDSKFFEQSRMKVDVLHRPK